MSRRIVYSNLKADIQAIQLANNSKIYISVPDSNFVSVIKGSDSTFDSVVFEFMGMKLGRTLNYGLPNFVSSYFHRPSVDFSYALNCSLNSIKLTEYDTLGASAFTWEIAKSTSSIPESSSSDRNPIFQFQDTGWYMIKLLVSNGNDTDSVNKEIHIKPKYELGLGHDTTLCPGQTLFLDAGSGQHCYLWQDSSMGSSFTVDSAGTYWVKVTTNNFCTYHDSISVSYSSFPLKPQITRSNDTLFTDTGYRYQWFRNGLTLNGADNSYYRFGSNGEYQVEVFNENGCGTVSDSFSVTNVSIRLPEKTTSFKLYPNPSKQGSEIWIKGDEVIQDVKVLDYTGKRIFEQSNIQKPSYRLKLEQRGIYIVIINGSNSHKIMIE